MSPNYPQQYDNNLDCNWTVKAPGENIITLTLSEFDTESRDMLKIYHGDNSDNNITDNSLPLATFFGDDSVPFTSTGNAIYLRFSTDSSDTKTGFKISAEAVGNDT